MSMCRCLAGELTMYLRAAVEAYQRWGAHTVARRLAATHSLDIKPGN